MTPTTNAVIIVAAGILAIGILLAGFLIGVGLDLLAKAIRERKP